MRIKLFTLFLLLKSISMLAQTNVYQPFPEDSALWTYHTQSGASSSYYQEEWLGDTTINSLLYTKIYSRDNNTPFKYVGAVRQDITNEKIYKINLNGIEEDISVNQHLGVNDTFPTTKSNPILIIKKIDSVSIGIKKHTRYNMTDPNNASAQWTYIFGVGMNVLAFEYARSLECFTVNNKVLIGSPLNPKCGFILININEEIKPLTGLNVYPNPTSGVFSLLVGNDTEEVSSVYVYNSLGEITYSKLHVSHAISKLSIDLQSQKNGVYLIRVSRAFRRNDHCLRWRSHQLNR